jgi:sugar phosphate isomerase/epimerase
MTSGINEVSAEQHTEVVLRTAAKLGVKRFRMNYYKYDLAKPIWAQLQEVKPKLKDLIQLCQEVGIQPLFQNHSGKDYFGAPIWDIYSLMQDYTPEQFSFCYDIFHATVEGGLQWPLSAALTSDRWGAIYFKDFKWEGRKAEGCPLGQGQVNPDFAKLLKKNNYSRPHLPPRRVSQRRPQGPRRAQRVPRGPPARLQSAQRLDGLGLMP